LDMVAATAATVVTLRKKSQKERDCQKKLNECLDTSGNDGKGNNLGEKRCLTCFGLCRHSGTWPQSIPLDDGPGTCLYPGYQP
jgi:hypothetical protein